MIGVIGHWDHKARLGPVGRRVLYQCYDYTARVYGAVKLVMVDIDGTLDVDVPKVGTLAEALGMFNDCTPVYIHAGGRTSLCEFRHPGDAVYIVGPDYNSFVVPDGATSVKIEVERDVPELWAHTALAVVLHDRNVKGL